MKRTIAILLSVVLLSSTIGIKVNKHFCATFLHSIHVFGEFDESTCCGDREESMDCCTDESDFFNFDEKYSFSTSEFVIQLPFLALIPSVWNELNIILIVQNLSKKYFHLFKPPPQNRRIHLLNSVFLI